MTDEVRYYDVARLKKIGTLLLLGGQGYLAGRLIECLLITCNNDTLPRGRTRLDRASFLTFFKIKSCKNLLPFNIKLQGTQKKPF